MPGVLPVCRWIGAPCVNFETAQKLSILASKYAGASGLKKYFPKRKMSWGSNVSRTKGSSVNEDLTLFLLFQVFEAWLTQCLLPSVLPPTSFLSILVMSVSIRNPTFVPQFPRWRIYIAINPLLYWLNVSDASCLLGNIFMK